MKQRPNFYLAVKRETSPEDQPESWTILQRGYLNRSAAREAAKYRRESGTPALVISVTHLHKIMKESRNGKSRSGSLSGFPP